MDSVTTRGGVPEGEPHPPATAALDSGHPFSVAAVDLEPQTTATVQVGARFITLHVLAYTGFNAAALAPVAVTLALKVDTLVGARNGAASLGLVVGVGAVLAMVSAPFWGKVSDRTTGRWGMRRPWMVVGILGGLLGALVMGLAPSVPVLLLGYCMSAFFVNAAGAVLVAVLADQVPIEQRGTVSGLLGLGGPVGLIAGTFLVQLVAPNAVLMFLLPAGVAAALILPFAVGLRDRHLDPAQKTPWSAKELASTFYVNPRRSPDFGWAWLSRFLFTFATATLTTYLTFYLINHLGSAKEDVPRQVFLGSLVLALISVAASIVGGRVSDATGRRKVFVLVAAVIFAVGLFLVATASGLGGFLVGAAVGGLGLGAYVAVELALVTDVLPDPENAAKDLGVFNIASTLPSSLAPAIAPLVLAIGGGSYAVLYAFAGTLGLLSALAILPVRRVR